MLRRFYSLDLLEDNGRIGDGHGKYILMPLLSCLVSRRSFYQFPHNHLKFGQLLFPDNQLHTRFLTVFSISASDPFACKRISSFLDPCLVRHLQLNYWQYLLHFFLFDPEVEVLSQTLILQSNSINDNSKIFCFLPNIKSLNPFLLILRKFFLHFV